jgi:hypothetical protein
LPEATVRVERGPGEEGQVDFGYAGEMIDPATGQRRRSWAFVMTLAWSRHQYVEFVFEQRVETWLRCHRNALNFFGGVPQRLVIDNLKAAIVKATQDDPAMQASYRECALHYGFLIAPCRVATPQHKGKVEQGGVHYVKRNFLGGREPTLISQANRDVLVWCNTTAGLRRHGTTKEPPLQRFEATEQARLQPLPTTPYDLAIWKQLKLGWDCYVEFDDSYYSAPHRLVGQHLWVCGNLQQVRLFDSDYHLLATHERAAQPGTRQTHLDHLPPEKVAGLTLNRETCLASAAQIGPATQQVVQALLDEPPCGDAEHRSWIGCRRRVGCSNSASAMGPRPWKRPVAGRWLMPIRATRTCGRLWPKTYGSEYVFRVQTVGFRMKKSINILHISR